MPSDGRGCRLVSLDSWNEVLSSVEYCSNPGACQRENLSRPSVSCEHSTGGKRPRVDVPFVSNLRRTLKGLLLRARRLGKTCTRLLYRLDTKSFCQCAGKLYFRCSP